jgi:hypothetical protein
MGKTLGQIAYEEYAKEAYSRMPDWDILPPDQRNRWYKVADSILPGRARVEEDPAIALAKRIKAVADLLSGYSLQAISEAIRLIERVDNG